MARISDETKALLKEFVGEDGQFLITESMPDDLKEALKFYNENNIDVFSDSADLDEEDDDDEEAGPLVSSALDELEKNPIEDDENELETLDLSNSSEDDNDADDLEGFL